MVKVKKEISTPIIKKAYFALKEKLMSSHEQIINASWPYNINFSVRPMIGEINKAKEALGALKDKFNFDEANEKIFNEKAGRLLDLQDDLIKEYGGEDINGLQEEISSKIQQLSRMIDSKKKIIIEKHFSFRGDV